MPFSKQKNWSDHGRMSAHGTISSVVDDCVDVVPTESMNSANRIVTFNNFTTRFSLNGYSTCL